jgi:hypothetical protein
MPRRKNSTKRLGSLYQTEKRSLYEKPVPDEMLRSRSKLVAGVHSIHDTKPA